MIAVQDIIKYHTIENSSEKQTEEYKELTSKLDSCSSEEAKELLYKVYTTCNDEDFYKVCVVTFFFPTFEVILRTNRDYINKCRRYRGFE
jgi:hypothetical protein